MNNTPPTSATIRFTIRPLLPLEPSGALDIGHPTYSEDETIPLKPSTTAQGLAAHLSGLLSIKVATDPELSDYTPSSTASGTHGSKPGQAQPLLDCSGHLYLRNAAGDEFLMRVSVLSVQ